MHYAKVFKNQQILNAHQIRLVFKYINIKQVYLNSLLMELANIAQ